MRTRAPFSGSTLRPTLPGTQERPHLGQERYTFASNIVLLILFRIRAHSSLAISGPVGAERGVGAMMI